MARQTNINSNSNRNEWTPVIDGVSVRKSGNSDYFSLNWFGAIIHGCSIRSGDHGDFISWPAFKNSEGKYVKRAYVWAEKGSDDETILEKVLRAAAKL